MLLILLEGLKNNFDLFEITNSSFVFGFLPNLCGVLLVKKVPKLEILTTLVLDFEVIKFKKIVRNSLLLSLDIRALEEILLQISRFPKLMIFRSKIRFQFQCQC